MVTAKPPIIGCSTSYIRSRSPDGKFSKSTIWVESSNFYGDSKSDRSGAYIIVGYDTEFKTPDKPVTLDEMKAGDAKYTVLSYQVHCSVYDPAQPDATEWSAICFPEPGERMKLVDILNLAFWKGISTGAVERLPTRVYVVGHFTRADVPAFADFKDLTAQIAAVRSTFTSVDKGIRIQTFFENGQTVELLVILRDTMLLTPATSKSLKEIGSLVDVPKIVLDTDPDKEQFYKRNMDLLLQEKPDIFEAYAINDAVICTRYLQHVISICEEVLRKRMAPATLTAIGVDLLMREWKEILKYDPLDVVGKEKVKSRYYSKEKGYYVTKYDNVPLEQLAFYLPLATECYHGGRGEQFWFGPAFEDDWTDYDLAGAYPTAMALIGYPDWRNIKPTTKLDDFTADQLGVANVSFEFPKTVRFPTMPVRTENGLVFPRAGVSNCSAPEIALARSLGAKLRIHHGAIVPTDPTRPVFRDFIRDCVAKRRSYPKGSLYNLFWKELSNSSYGKTAQGLHSKRVYDLKDRAMRELPPSKITNPFFAAYITSFVRAALGEVMNGLPESVCVFSCTTDGFLTNATEAQIASAQGSICARFSESRDRLTGDPTVLEIKHHVRQPLGWRTRGQATLIEGDTDKGDGVNIVLAKGGIYTAWNLDTVKLQNAFVTDLFLNRKPTDRIEMATKTGIRDMINFDADLVEKETSKRLNMEFDWKRRPTAAWDAIKPNHLAFSTTAWDTVDQFVEMRGYWESFAISDKPRCLKTVDDYRTFAVSVMSQSSLKHGGSKYLKKTDPDLKRLRQSLCAAWRYSKAGLIKGVNCRTAQQFAETLSAAGISCKRSDVENVRTGFKPKNCPKTPAVLTVLDQLLEQFPTLEIDTLVTSNEGIDILDALSRSNPFSVNKQKLRRNPEK